MLLDCIDLPTQISTVDVSKNLLSKGPTGMRLAKTHQQHIFIASFFFPMNADSLLYYCLLFWSRLSLFLFHSFCTFSNNPGEVTRITNCIFFSLINSGLFCFLLFFSFSTPKSVGREYTQLL